MNDSTSFRAAALTGRLSAVPLLSQLDAASLADLEARLEWLSVPGGSTLFREGEVADALYVVIVGCLAVTVRGGDGHDVLVACSRAGDTVGEMGLLGGELRSASVTALRDSELLRLEKSSFDWLVERHPRSMLSIASQLARRLQTTTHRAGEGLAIRSVALIPVEPDIDHHRIARELAAQLATHGQRIALLSSESAAHTAEWFNAVEAASDKVLYHADPGNFSWSRLCLRQADRVILIASSERAPSMPSWLDGRGKDRRQPLDLVLLHDGIGGAGQSAQQWRNLPAIDLICHVRRDNTDDVARLARLLNGNAVGVVLGGGGARGFAHLGILRALREAQIPIDLIGGCSIGAIVGAGVALEWDDTEIRERLRRAFVDSNPINDYTLPFLALVKGHKVTRRLEEHFGSIRIEDLWRPFYCVSTNLTAGNLAVHRDGRLVDALRASLSIPGLLPPVMIDGEAHVDGGMINCLPVDVMSPMCGAVIAADVAHDPLRTPFPELNETPSLWQLLRRSKIPPIVDLLVRAATINSDALARTVRARASILFQPPLETVNLLDWQACDRAIDIGYRHAIEKLEQSDISALLRPR
jgi:NTE family protein